eukprot:6180539-Pleurochrysis_carterae.AAC.1
MLSNGVLRCGRCGISVPASNHQDDQRPGTTANTPFEVIPSAPRFQMRQTALNNTKDAPVDFPMMCGTHPRASCDQSM